MAQAKRLYLCNLIPLWKIDEKNLEADWSQNQAYEGNIVEMRVLIKNIALSVEPFNFSIQFDIYENDFLLFGGSDDHVLTITNQLSVGSGYESRPLMVLDNNTSILLEQPLGHIFVTPIKPEEGTSTTLIRAYWKTTCQKDIVGNPEYFFDVRLTVGNKEYKERSDQELTIIEAKPVEIIIETQGMFPTEVSPLRKAWVYWREEKNTLLLRTDDTGHLLAAAEDKNIPQDILDTLRPLENTEFANEEDFLNTIRKQIGPEQTDRYKTLILRQAVKRSHPWEYKTPFRSNIGTQARLYFSRGARPIPNAILEANNNAFSDLTVTLAPMGTEQKIPERAVIRLPEIQISLTNPGELSIWPLLWELHGDDYYINGLPQGAELWDAGGALTVMENYTAPAPDATVRPKERGLRVEGRIDARATGVILKIFDVRGNRVILVENSHTTPFIRREQISCILHTPTGNQRPFEASIFLENAVNVFGPIQILIQSEGINPPLIEAFYVHLAGFQIALVDDYTTDSSGTRRGPLLNETDERIIVAFQDSPQPTQARLSVQTKSRRMISYQFANRAHPFLKPQMPMWMTELECVGISRNYLQELMAHRHFRENVGVYRPPFALVNLRFELQWRLILSWDGPDSNIAANHPDYRPNQTYQYQAVIQEARPQIVHLCFRDGGCLIDPVKGQDIVIGDQGNVPKAFQPAPDPIPFPVNDRRLPQVFISGQNRSWGRYPGAIQRDTLVIEFQPHIVDDANQEIIRGGDGVLELLTLAIDGQNIATGLVPTGTGILAPPPQTDPVIRLPRFRVRGLNPALNTDVENLVDTLVEEYYRAHNTLPRITLLPLNIWQDTARRIFQLESGIWGGYFQFDDRGTIRRNWEGNYYGCEQDMPLFGPPHGYGIGQLDLIFGRGANSDEVWSFVENPRSAIRLIMEEKATIAYNLFTVGTGAATFNGYDIRRRRAMYQREIVRRYNGGQEFSFQNNAWVINPSLQWENQGTSNQRPHSNLLYPNQVLNTNIVYFTNPNTGTANNPNAGAATLFNWPINFTAANYGPGI